MLAALHAELAAAISDLAASVRIAAAHAASRAECSTVTTDAQEAKCDADAAQPNDQECRMESRLAMRLLVLHDRSGGLIK